MQINFVISSNSKGNYESDPNNLTLKPRYKKGRQNIKGKNDGKREEKGKRANVQIFSQVIFGHLKYTNMSQYEQAWLLKEEKI